MELQLEKHIKFLVKMSSDRGFEWTMSEYLRMSGIYWCVTALATLQVVLEAKTTSLILKFGEDLNSYL